MELTPLTAISPVDGRYRGKSVRLADYFSEYATIRYRVKVEIEYFIALSNIGLPQLPPLSENEIEALRAIYAPENFTLASAEAVKTRGWSVPSEGFDVEHSDKHIFVELKNKHNTMNSASSQKTYMKMQSKLLEDDQATCYLVEVISKKSRDDAWRITLDKKVCAHNKIRRMSIDRFYEMVFEDSEAFYKLCVALPLIIEDVIKENPGLALKNTVYDSLIAEHSDLLTALYLLAFSTYEGFETLKK